MEITDMYAIIEQGGKQYKVSQGDKINIELVDVAEGAETIELGNVLFVNDGEQVKVGTPYLEGAKVVAKLDVFNGDAVVKGPKVYPTYFRRRKNSKKRIGHRQKYLQVVIDSIEV
jgi:large subunit ribosomal protein L21